MAELAVKLLRFAREHDMPLLALACLLALGVLAWRFWRSRRGKNEGAS